MALKRHLTLAVTQAVYAYETSSRLHLSSKSLPGVLEDMDVLDGAGDGVRVLIISLGSFTENFIKVKDQVYTTTNLIF